MGGQFVESSESVEEEADEEHTTTGEGTSSGLWKVQVDTTNDQSDSNGRSEGYEDIKAVSEDHLHLTNSEDLYLTEEADGVDTLGTNTLMLVLEDGLAELLLSTIVGCDLSIVLLLLAEHVLVDRRPVVGLLKALGGGRYGGLVLAVGEAVEVGVGTSRAEVGRSLTRIVLEA